jgi:capsular polysaccharide biosynthesis protein
MISHNILCNPVIIFMIGLLIAVIIAIFMALLNAIDVIAQSHNETNETDIGENQSVSGRISGFREDFGFSPRVVDNPAMVNSS